jgi:sugar O-acyltransferase (sialic acid O-acetyltransferase NeuD family)
MRSLVIIGAGGHGRSVAEAVLLCNEYSLAGFLDDSWPDNLIVWKYPIFGDTSSLALCSYYGDAAIVAIGNNSVRSGLQKRLIETGMPIATIIHPEAMVSPRAVIGAGSTIMAGAVVGTEAELGAGVIVNCGGVVDHHCRLGDFAHLGVNACMAGGSVLGEGAWMQAGSSLGYRVEIPPGDVIGPGIGRSEP